MVVPLRLGHMKLMADGFSPVAFEPWFQSSDGLRAVELDALFLHARPAPAPTGASRHVKLTPGPGRGGAAHERGQCSAWDRRPFLPLPRDIPMTEEDWT